ncbi:MAG: glycosyltransferase family 9 protein [Pirellulales bacterium]
MHNIVVIMPRWVGDVVMATPLLRGLRRHFLHARITAVLRPLAVELLSGTEWFDNTILYDRHSGRSEFGFKSAVKQLRALRADAAIVIPNSLSSASLAYFGGVRRRVGMAMHYRRFFLTDPVSPPRDGWRRKPFSSASYPVLLGKRLGMPSEPLRLELAIMSEDRELGGSVLERLFPGFDASTTLIVINDGAAFGPSKRWGNEKVAQLSHFLIKRIPTARILIHCGPGERDEARTVCRVVGHPSVQSLADEPAIPFGLSKSVIQRADVVISTDSGPRHIAAAFQRPTVVIHGPMDPVLSRSEHDKLVEVRLDLSCSPCGQSICPLKHHDCMQLLSVEDVGINVIKFLETSS